MKILRLSLPLVLATLLFTGSLAMISPAFAADPDRSDNKVLVSGVPGGWAIQVAQPGSEFPRGPGNLPDNAGFATAYAPLGKISQVYLWDKNANAYHLIATISPTSTWPDTALSVPLQYAQGFPSPGLASPIQVSPGFPAPLMPSSQVPLALGQQQYVVRAGDTLSGIARQHGTTTASLAAVNGIANPNLIIVGQVLTLPAPGQ